VSNAQGELVYPGFPADVLWKFRLYSVIAQLIVWSVIGLVFSNLIERVVGRTVGPAAAASRQPANV
jgi:hypothetical protein